MRPFFAFASLAVGLAGAVSSPAAFAACYVVYGPSEQVIYRASEPPVNLSFPLHQTVPVLAPGATLVFSLDNHGCESEVDLLSQSAASRQPGAAQPATFPRAPRAPRG